MQQSKRENVSELLKSKTTTVKEIAKRCGQGYHTSFFRKDSPSFLLPVLFKICCPFCPFFSLFVLIVLFFAFCPFCSYKLILVLLRFTCRLYTRMAIMMI